MRLLRRKIAPYEIDYDLIMSKIPGQDLMGLYVYLDSARIGFMFPKHMYVDWLSSSKLLVKNRHNSGTYYEFSSSMEFLSWLTHCRRAYDFHRPHCVISCSFAAYLCDQA